jgi:Dolichyl-phosphate-mannose-protein mannosyltransferase
MTDLSAENNEVSIKPVQLIILFAALQFVIAFFTDPMMLTFDESMWHYIGRNWIRNQLIPYTGGIDNKSPLIFFIFGISDWLFGVNYWFPRVMGILVQSAGIYGLYKVAVGTIGRKAGIYAISFYGLSLLWRSTGGKYISYTETYAITAIVISISYVIVSRKKNGSFVGGLFAGIGFAFRITAFFGILPVLVHLFNRNWRVSLSFIAGMLTSIAVLILMGQFVGIRLTDFLFYGVTDNFGTGSATDHSFIWKIQRFGEGIFYSEIILFYPAVIFYFLAIKKFDFLKVWFMSELAGIIILGTYDRSHFKNILPAMSLMGAFIVNFLVVNYGLPTKKILLGLWIAFFPKTLEPLFAFRKLIVMGNKVTAVRKNISPNDNENSRKLLGLWIKNKTGINEKVFIAGFSSQAQVYSERISPSVYFNATQTMFAKKRLFSDLLMDKPALVVIPVFESYPILVDKDVRHFISNLVQSDYSLDTSIYNYNVFRLNNTRFR